MWGLGAFPTAISLMRATASILPQATWALHPSRLKRLTFCDLAVGGPCGGWPYDKGPSISGSRLGSQILSKLSSVNSTCDLAA